VAGVVSDLVLVLTGRAMVAVGSDADPGVVLALRAILADTAAGGVVLASRAVSTTNGAANGEATIRASCA
jgi:hypothetical protein